MKKTTKRLIVAILTLALAFSIVAPATTVSAASKNSKKGTTTTTSSSKSGLTDVQNARKEYRSAVKKLYKNGYLKGLVKKNKFYPAKTIKRSEFTKILVNLYGDRITVTSGMLSDKAVTYKWMYSTLTKISDELGYKVTWSGYTSKAKAKRDAACNAIVVQINFAESKGADNLTPTKWK